MYIFSLVILPSLLVPNSAWLVQVDSHKDDCYYERVEAGDKVGLTFQVIDGGFLDIDVNIKGPDGHEIYTGPRETSGKYTFLAYKEGKYEMCFSNKMSTITPKWIMFHVVSENPSARGADGDNNSTLGQSETMLKGMVNELAEALRGVHHEQDYLLVRTKLQHHTSEHTNIVVVRGALYLIFLITFGCVFQIWYYKRFFEIRRIV